MSSLGRQDGGGYDGGLRRSGCFLSSKFSWVTFDRLPIICGVHNSTAYRSTDIKDLILPVQTEPFGSLSPIDDATSGQRIQAAAIALQPNLRHMDRRSLAMKMVKSVAYAYDSLDHERKLSTVENLVQRWREGERGYLVSLSAPRA